MKADSVLATIGDTAHIRLSRLFPDHEVWVKNERANPGGSIKDRIGLAMIEDAEAAGKLKPGGTIVEPTSGNTGIGLAMTAAVKGYKLVLVMPESMSVERRRLMLAYGATFDLTPKEKGMKGAIERAQELVEQTEGAWMPSQFDNPANPQIHETTTGPEIWEDTNGAIDILVSGVGTGGTITGISRYIKNTQGKAITSVAVEPDTTTMITAAKAGEEPTHAPHKIQGIGAGFVPDNLDLDMVDQVEQVTSDEAIVWAHKLMKEEGILAGISSGAAMAVADRVAQQPGNKGKNIVVILPDSAERYLSTPLFEGMFSEAETVQTAMSNS